MSPFRRWPATVQRRLVTDCERRVLSAACRVVQSCIARPAPASARSCLGTPAPDLIRGRTLPPRWLGTKRPRVKPGAGVPDTYLTDKCRITPVTDCELRIPAASGRQPRGVALPRIASEESFAPPVAPRRPVLSRETCSRFRPVLPWKTRPGPDPGPHSPPAPTWDQEAPGQARGGCSWRLPDRQEPDCPDLIRGCFVHPDRLGTKGPRVKPGAGIPGIYPTDWSLTPWSRIASDESLPPVAGNCAASPCHGLRSLRPDSAGNRRPCRVARPRIASDQTGVSPSAPAAPHGLSADLEPCVPLQPATANRAASPGPGSRST